MSAPKLDMYLAEIPPDKELVKQVQHVFPLDGQSTNALAGQSTRSMARYLCGKISYAIQWNGMLTTHGDGSR